MKLFILVVSLCLLTVAGIKAQDTLPPLFEINSEGTDAFTLPNDNIQVLEDNTGKLSFEQVSTMPLVNGFHANNNKKLNLAAYAFWFRYRLRNMANHDIDISFDVEAEFGELYIKTADSVAKHLQTGWNLPWSKRDGLRLETVLSFTMKPGQEFIIYHRERFDQTYLLPKDHNITYSSTASIIKNLYVNKEEQDLRKIVVMLFAGILIMAALFNFFFFSTTKDKVYLYFALFAFVYGLIPYSESLIEFLLREAPSLANNIETVGWFFFNVFFVNFFRHYLETYKYHRVWDRILVITLYIHAAVIFLFIFLQNIVSHLWRFILADSHGFMVQLVGLLIFVVSLLYLNPKNTIRSRIIPALPILFFWGPVWSYIYVDSLFVRYAGYKTAGFIDWIVKWNPLIELLSLGWFVLFFTWSLFKRYQQLQKQVAQNELEKEIERNQLIARQKIELEQQVTERTAELKQSLESLKATQSQLIQSEKMASLGELTAGIAHEIQNPLNFVNNFSEVNNELIEELKNQKSKLKTEEQDAILNDIFQNNEKINHHGKRADAIVKGMLQHSRSSSGVKEPTDINALAEEYLRLAYHGLRAKDKSFNATLKTDLDESIGNINIIPQDIGRVILNLITNAFYAVNEKKTLRPDSYRDQGDSYEPTVSVSTKKTGDKIEIKVKDNGNGIPQKVLDKIFQPFFTTKPTGQGTGLGLSLSYDIIKAHGGNLKVNTKEGEFAEFVITLPL